MFSRHAMRNMRRKLKLEMSGGEVDDLEELDDASIISKWIHNTNIEASNALLERLNKYHKLIPREESVE